VDWLGAFFNSVFLSLYNLSRRLRGRVFTILCRSSFYHVGPGTALLPPARLGGEKWIEIGRNVFIGPNSWLEVMEPPVGNHEPVITIGDETSIVGSCTITALERVVIEPKVLIAGNVYISDHAHAHGSREAPIKNQGLSNIAPVRVCEGAWLGQNVVVCPGATIGRNAVVGANSVVRQDIPDFAVAAGCPAKIIRMIDHAN
jgi:acetyltransferase-like isoleucine patch superfamily enzyme